MPVVFPEFNEAGDLPPGVHRATLSDTLQRFGQGTVQRRAAADRLNRLYRLVASTGQLTRFVVFGSFVTAKAEPNDVNVILLMEDTFDLAAVTGEAGLAFQHMEARDDVRAYLDRRRVETEALWAEIEAERPRVSREALLARPTVSRTPE